MLILLPPSEGKAGTGTPLDVGRLSFPQLTSTREKVLDALVGLCHEPGAAEVLGLTPGQAEVAVARNRKLREAGTLPAGELYTGVLYDNLGLASLSRAADVVIFSGLWGALRPGDAVPPYRLSIAVNLPPLGSLAQVWRPALEEVFSGGGDLVVDMRSAAYAAAWNPGERCAAVRVLKEQGGKRSVVSHLAKATRGQVARALLQAGAAPDSPQEFAEALTDLGWTAELHPPVRSGKPWTLDVVIAA